MISIQTLDAVFLQLMSNSCATSDKACSIRFHRCFADHDIRGTFGQYIVVTDRFVPCILDDLGHRFR